VKEALWRQRRLVAEHLELVDLLVVVGLAVVERDPQQTGRGGEARRFPVAAMKIRIIGVPMDLGGDRRGVDMGPSAIRYADLEERLEKIGHKVEDQGDIPVPIPESRIIKDPTAKYLPEIVKANTPPV